MNNRYYRLKSRDGLYSEIKPLSERRDRFRNALRPRLKAYVVQDREPTEADLMECEERSYRYRKQITIYEFEEE